MKNKILIILPFLLSALAGCSTSTPSISKCEHDYDYFIKKDSYWRTYIAGSDFDDDGLEVAKRCKKCGETEVVDYELENDKNLKLNQNSVSIKGDGFTYNYEIQVKEKFHIACCGDSLTAGHYWPNESYPSKLSAIVDEKYQVENCGVNGISITGYGGSWDDPEMRYIKQDVYKKSVDFAPDIFAIMLGTNDATGWEKAKDIYEDEYRVLLDSYIDQFPFAKFIMMVSPPVVTPNQFGIPNDEIRNYVNPIQRDLADEYGFEVLNLREEFEAVEGFETKFLRPNNDNVHFTAEGAQFVADRVWEIAKDLTF